MTKIHRKDTAHSRDSPKTDAGGTQVSCSKTLLVFRRLNVRMGGASVMRMLIGAFCLPLVACSGSIKPSATAEALLPHHPRGGYQNNYVDYQSKSLSAVLSWKWSAFRRGLPKAPLNETPLVQPDLAFIHANAQARTEMRPAVTWIGHSTALMQMGGINIVTDPIFSPRASPLTWVGTRRAQRPGLLPAELPHVDVVLVSHNHYDHCDMASLLALNAQAGGPPNSSCHWVSRHG